jgi:hypothetical protein
MKNRVVMVIVVILLSGCVSQMPQTAEEFRKAVPGAFMSKVETFDVNRPLRDVAKTFQAKAPECLNVKVRTTSQRTSSQIVSSQVTVVSYKPTVRVTREKAELHVQHHFESGVQTVHKEPPGGYYLMVVDAVPLENNRTRITFYRPSMGYDTMVTAITGWATGKNVGCPDLSKD